MFECVVVRVFFQNVSKLFIEIVFLFFFFLSFLLARRPDRGRQTGLFTSIFFYFTFGMAPEMRKRSNKKGQNGARSLPRLPVWPDSCALVSSKGKIAKRVVWMIALAGCAQAGWIARGTRPEQGEPIYILCNFLYHVTHLVLLFLIHLFMLVGDVRKCTFTVYV